MVAGFLARLAIGSEHYRSGTAVCRIRRWLPSLRIKARRSPPSLVSRRDRYNNKQTGVTNPPRIATISKRESQVLAAQQPLVYLPQYKHHRHCVRGKRFSSPHRADHLDWFCLFPDATVEGAWLHTKTGTIVGSCIW